MLSMPFPEPVVRQPSRRRGRLGCVIVLSPPMVVRCQPIQILLSCIVLREFACSYCLRSFANLSCVPPVLNVDSGPHNTMTYPAHFCTLDIVWYHLPVFILWRFVVVCLKPARDHAARYRVLLKTKHRHGEVVHYVSRFEVVDVHLVVLNVQFVCRLDVVGRIEFAVLAGVVKVHAHCCAITRISTVFGSSGIFCLT